MRSNLEKPADVARYVNWTVLLSQGKEFSLFPFFSRFSHGIKARRSRIEVKQAGQRAAQLVDLDGWRAVDGSMDKI